ncbi:hypothetical protein NDU88_000603 [Pleurodeles waltl]|uniref:Uncharacterized protein n=1 Tax=Pleurodeles waltl TaxID=8319 RepID=A0AAV7TFC1_PLEWA|nr:hypothetical protein NDU88_000603 [Pleurodeles waltl]
MAAPARRKTEGRTTEENQGTALHRHSKKPPDTGASSGTCAGPEAAILTSSKGDRRKELGRRARPGGDEGET